MSHDQPTRHLKIVVQFGEGIQAKYIFCVGGCIVETSNSFCTRGTFCTFIATWQVSVLQARHAESTISTFLVGGTVSTNTRGATYAWFTVLTLIATLFVGMINAMNAIATLTATC